MSIIFVLLFNNTNYCYASQLSNNELVIKKENNMITGSKESIQTLSKEVNNLLYIDIKTDVKKVTNNEFAQKPTIIDTQSRLEIEEQKKLEKEQKELEQYNSYLAYNTYQRDTYTRESTATRYIDNTESNANTYSYGYCTWYVAGKKNVPGSWGNAGQWIYSAQASGYSTGYTPTPQSIIVTSESGWGHVGIVEEINGDSMIISEMNYIGWGITSTREISLNNPVIKGYIY